MKKIFLTITAALFTMTCGYSRELNECSFQINFESESAARQIMASRPELNFVRIIPEASNNILEQRHRDVGLHLWYRIDVKDDMTAENEAKAFSARKGVLYARRTELIRLPEKEGIADAVSAPDKKIVDANGANDPLRDMQWHFFNTDCTGINLEKAWKLEQGKRNVIVAVMDGWIDYTHDDLAANMWVNEKELHGLQGVDDDGNGYVDDIHGLNLLDNYTFSSHATHIAGTIAAVNNNGIGVCGIAGGDGVDSGVKVMSVCVNSDKNFVSDWLMAQAYVYAADNGAVISSNSWRGLDLPSPIIKEGIKYFMHYAGHYVGSPMNGGLVVFAAGNDNSNIAPGPINDFNLRGDRFIAVAATGQTGLRSSFSNYGTWVDIAAPGGDFDGKGIYSTYPDNKYGFMNGTSMACPHVSGVAALVVSKYGDGSLTPGKVKSILKNTAAPINPMQAGYPYAEQMGAGIVDARQALMGMPDVRPSCPSDFNVTVDKNRHYLFTFRVPADANGSPVSSCAIYANNSKIPMITVQTTGTSVGQIFSYYVNEENIVGTNEYSIESVDFAGNKSIRSELVAASEKAEQNWIYNQYGTSNITLYKPDKDYTRPLPTNKLDFPYICASECRFMIEEPNGVVSRMTTFKSELSFDLNVDENTPIGTFPLTIKIVNTADNSEVFTLPMTYTVWDALKNLTGPKPKNPSDMHFYTSNLKGSFDLNVRDYIYDPHGLDFTIPDYSYVVDWDPIIVSMSYTIKNDRLHVEYEFDEEGVAYEPDPVIDIPFSAINTYFVDGKPTFHIHYVDKSGVDEITDQNNADFGAKGIYTIAGIRVNKSVGELAPGFYIIDGKKMCITKR